MTYPLSKPVSAGQPTAAEHYNNLRKDALNLGESEADSINLRTFFGGYSSGIKLQYLPNNRVRVPYSSSTPPTMMIKGYMLQADGHVDLPAGLISGPAATWYIFAVRSPGSNTFTITANTSASESTDLRRIGQAIWNGSSLGAIQCYLDQGSLPAADYDSGWFACAPNNLYTRPHGLGTVPRLVVLYHALDAAGAGEWVPVQVVQNTLSVQSPLSFDAVNIYVQTGISAEYNATCFSTRRNSLGGYYRLLAWS